MTTACNSEKFSAFASVLVSVLMFLLLFCQQPRSFFSIYLLFSQMDSGEEFTKPGLSLLESMLILDSASQLPRTSPMVTVSQVAPQSLSRSVWGSHGIMTEESSSGASSVTVRYPFTLFRQALES